ncbi:MAG TPA: hypothetical protein ENK57_06375 [Polyangiaceae bacterium]|nr:hypothetical protein [Polyangiaceae bacterium]
MQIVVGQAFEAVCGRSIDDPLLLSIGEEDAETVTKLMAVDSMAPPLPEEQTEVTVPRGRAVEDIVPGDEETVPFRPDESVRPPAMPPPTPPMASMPPPSNVGGGQTWIKRALAEPGHAKEAMWLVRLGFATVVLMMVGALVWVLSMPDDAPEASAQPPDTASINDAAAVSASLDAPLPESGSEEGEASAEESDDEGTAAAADASSSVSAAESAPPPVTAAPPTVSVNPAWPPKSAGTTTSEPPRQFLKPGPLGPEMDP